jgi:cell division protein FtsA
MTGSEAKLTIYFTFAPVLHVNYLKTVTDSIQVKLLGIVAQPFAIARAIKGANNSDYSSIIVDIGGGTTDIAVIQNGISVGTHMIAFGSRVFTKHIATDLNLTLADAEDFKIKYSDGNLSDVRMQQVRTTVTKYTPFWALQLAIGLEEFLGIVKGFPHSLYLCGGGALLPEIKSSIIEFPWSKELPFNRHPKPEYLYPSDLNDIVDDKGLLQSIDDVTPASIARFTLEILDK